MLTLVNERTKMKREQSKFICFIGIDGSGKTTLAKSLAASLRDSGKNATYVYNRSKAILVKPFSELGRLLFLRGHDMFSDYAAYSSRKQSLFQHRLFFALYRSVFLLDYWIQSLIKIKAPLWRGTTVVCDRYLHDTIITDFAVHGHYTTDQVAAVLERWLHIFPRPDLVFMVDVDEAVAYKRKSDTPSLEYLKERRWLYAAIAQSYGAIALDGSMDLTALQSQTRQIALSSFGSQGER
jgi:dTMP kinase